MAKRKYKRRRRRRKTSGFLKRIIRSLVSIVILCALILGVILVITRLNEIEDSQFEEVKIPMSSETAIPIKKKSEEKLSVAILSDIHENYENLGKAIAKIQEKEIGTVFILGDITNYGEKNVLLETEDILDSSGLDYYILPGDHDLAATLSTQNFLDVFETNYYFETINGVNFLVLDNSANFTKIDPNIILWFGENISKADFVLLSQPLEVDCLGFPYSKTYMGSTWSDIEDLELLAKQEAVLAQRNLLVKQIRSMTNVRAVIAGDHHNSASCVDSENSDLVHYYVGSVTDSIDRDSYEINVDPMFSILTIYEDGSYQLKDILLN